VGARNSIATIAVKNLEVARVYYEEKLGLEVARELPEGISYRTGGTSSSSTRPGMPARTRRRV
jgi:catechol 2,3-dioxygenase-like lactoylglutathione lyase family enzyme